jgi:hypothetical protein
MKLSIDPLVSLYILWATSVVAMEAEDRHSIHIVTQEWMEDFAEGKLKEVVATVIADMLLDDSLEDFSTEDDDNRDCSTDPSVTPGPPCVPTVHEKAAEEASQTHRSMIKSRASLDNHTAKEVSRDDRAIIFVTGPESTGNRYIVDMIVKAAGCAGRSGHAQPLDHKGRGRTKDWGALDRRILENLQNTKCVALHRSFPHNTQFIDLKRMAQTARGKGFDPRVVVLTRFMPAIIDSQIERKHVTSEAKARENIKRAYLEIFDDVIDAQLPFTMVTYESLGDEEYIQWLFRELGLPYDPYKVPEFHDADSKHLN